MALQYYSFQFSNFVFGGVGSPYQVLSVDGLESLPELRVQDDERGYNDGMFSGRDFFAGRHITLTINTFAGNGYSAQQNFNLLQAAIQPQNTGVTPLQFQLSPADPVMTMNARVRGNKTTIDPDYTFGLIRSQLTFFAPDPRYYTAQTFSLAMTPTTVTGRTYPRTYNLTYGGGSQTNSVVVNNTGWTTTYPTITITGPITSPTVTNNSTSQYIAINTTLGVGDTVTIDLLNKLVLRNGSPARNLLAGNSLWFGCAPGNTTIGLSGSSTTIGTTSATLTYAPAYV